MRKAIRLALLGAVALGTVSACLAWQVFEGRMTGGGSFFIGTMRVTHGFELHCNASEGPNNLEVNWDGGNHFHLDTLTEAACFDSGAPAAPPKDTDFTTLVGGGSGTLNGVPGAFINFQFEDHGEPGTNDVVAYIIISDVNGNVVLMGGPALLNNGNHQAHTSPH
ncbi:MAG TPA: hypothetical protein VFW83_07885 [Bryobacteraceae bacterium]|nr:hypothetical protein [Bryobacteraceae bacterium]